MDPDLLRRIAVFVEVAKARTITGAAASLGMPKSTVSRHVSELERRIRMRLFNRTTRRIELTDEGLRYFERCRGVLDEVQIAHEQLTQSHDSPRGHLRVAAPIQMVWHITAGITEFLRRNPDLTIDLDVAQRRVDLVAERYDVVVHIGPPPDSSLVVRRLAVFARFLYASPAYLEARGKPAQPADLARHECLYWSRGEPRGSEHRWVLTRGRQRLEVPVGVRISVNSLNVIHQLTLQGAGIAVLAESLTRQDVQSGRLKRVLPGWSAEPMPAYALTATRLLPAKTRAFVEFLAQQLRKYNPGA